MRGLFACGQMDALSSIPMDTTSLVLACFAVAFAYCVLEQLQFRWTCKQLPSPPGLFWPVVGGIVASACPAQTSRPRLNAGG